MRVASLGTGVAFVSAVEETERRSEPPVPLWRRLSFDQRFALDQPSDFPAGTQKVKVLLDVDRNAFWDLYVDLMTRRMTP